MTDSHSDITQFPLSDLQQGMLFHTLSSLRKSTYLVQKVIRFTEPVNLQALEEAWNVVMKRYVVLRSYFDSQEHYYTHQCIQDACEVPLTWLDYSSKKQEVNDSLEAFLLEDANQGIHLSKPPLMRVTCLFYSEALSYCIWTYHHALMGGPSTIEVLKDLIIAYEALKSGANPVFKETPGGFFIEDLKSVDEEVGRHYWQSLFAGSEACGQVPGVYNSSPLALRQSVYRFKLDEKSTAKLLKIAEARHLSPSTFIFGAWGLLLSRYLNSSEVVFGTVRAYPKNLVQQHAGLFINTLPIRITTAKQTVASFLQEIRRQYKNLEQFIAMPLSKLQRWVGSHPKEALFETFVDFKSFSLNDTLKQALGDLWNNKYAYQHFDINYAFSLEAQKEESCFVFDINYECGQFSERTIARYAQHFLEILLFLLKEESTSLEALALVVEKELTGYPHKTTHQLSTVLEQFDKVVSLNPDKNLLIDEHIQMTAQQVYDKSIHLAKAIKKTTQAPLVALLFERSVDMVLSILAVWRSGAAFLPIDIAAPKSRIESLLAQADVNLVLSNKTSLELYPYIKELDCKVLNLDEVFSSPMAEISLEKITPEQLAYVIYTSGSTGKPKGVMIEHRSLANYVHWFSSFANLKQDDISVLMLPYFFDASYTNLFPALALGHCLCIPSQNTLQDVFSIFNFMEKNKVSYLKITPSFFRALVRSNFCADLKHLELIILGGEPIDVKDVAAFNRLYPHIKFINHYGPTETTIGCCATKIDFDKYSEFEALPVVGKPISGVFALVVDSQMRLQPVGVIGELLVGGLGVARGYLGDVQLTDELFISHPDFPGERLYKTGDLAIYLEQGALKLHSRKDAQIKIRGHRIDAKEIEHAILGLGIAKQVEICKTNAASGGDKLVAYIEPLESDMLTSRNSVALSSWAHMYDQLYGLENQQELNSFTTGTWVSAYDHEKIPEAQMKEWQQAIVERITEQGEGRILEIGCGTGLILFGLQNQYQHYFGIDISHTAIDILKQKIQKFELKEVTLACAAAHELDKIAALDGAVFDTIILNSVVQYFPCLEYLQDVFSWCLEKVSDEGVIIIGDVRDYRLMSAYYDSLFLAQHVNAQQDFERRRHYQFVRKVQEKELLIDPEFFIGLKTKNKKIKSVDVLAKQGKASNELNTWRYDVIIKKSSVIPNEEEQFFRYAYEPHFDLNAYFDTHPPAFCISNTPNYRLWSSYWASAYLEGRVEQFSLPNFPFTLDAIHELARKNGYVFKPYLATGFKDAAAFLDLFFVRQDMEQEILFHSDISKVCPTSKMSTKPLFVYQYQQQDLLKIKASLEEQLPDYMIPQQFIFVPEIPITPNGKVDKKRLMALSVSPTTSKENYLAPRNELEMQLAQIWQELLGIETIGVLDDFFTLGGDSILSIQMISKCRALGLSIQLIDFIENPSIEGMVSKIVASQSAPESPISAEGEVSLTPIQQWFFARKLAHPEHYNQAFLVQVNSLLERKTLEQIFNSLAQHHESLRLRYQYKGEGHWRQYYENSSQLFYLNDCSHLNEEAFYKAFNQSQSQFDLEKGPLLTISFRCHQGQTQILMAMHHLIVDGLSWRLWLEDLQSLIETGSLGTKTDSYQLWVQALERSVHSPWFATDYQYWKQLADNLENKQVLSFSMPSVRGTYKDILQISLNFSLENTAYLIKVLPEEYGLRIHEILFSVYVLSLKEWKNVDAVLINMEGHGREACIEGADVFRTLGWFTSLFPALMDLSQVKQEEDDIFSEYLPVIKQLNSIPNHGISFGLMHGLRGGVVPKWVKLLSDTGLKFNYLGQFQDAQNSSLIHSTMKWNEATTALDNQPDYLLFLQALIKDGSLQCELRYDATVFTDQDIQQLGNFYQGRLDAVIDHLKKHNKTFFIEKNNDQFDLHEF